MIETFAVENDFVQATTDFTLIRYYLLIVANVMLGSIHGSFSAHAHNHHPPHNIAQELELFLSVHDVKGTPHSDEAQIIEFSSFESIT